MFTGHYAPALALHRRFPAVALWKLFLAVQAMDVLFWGLVVGGVERMHLDPSQKGSLSLVLESMPYSHSFVATSAWAGLWVLQTRSREGVILAVAAISHWFMDLLVHTPDLTISPGDTVMVGFGLWSWPVVAWLLECAVLAAAAWGLSRRIQAFVGALVLLQTLQTFVIPMPTTVPALAALTEFSYFGLALAAWWVARPATRTG